VGFAGPDSSFEALSGLLPEVKVRKGDGHVFLGGTPLKITGHDTLRDDVARFTDFANALLVLSSSDTVPIRFHGPIYQETGGSRQWTTTIEPAKIPLAGCPVILSGTGSTSRPKPRALSIRVAELFARCDHFRDASVWLASAGDDLRELYKVMEAIERLTGAGRERKKRLVGRPEPRYAPP
jgi:hypothetical protein